jgi:hypothetical protein
MESDRTMTGQSYPPPLDPEIVKALHWCRIGRVRPDDDSAFQRAKQMGLLAQDSCWRATERGEGVLIALGLIEGKPAPRRTFRTVLWAVTDRYPPNFAGSWSEYEEETYGDDVRERAEEEWRINFPDDPWQFFTTTEPVNVPSDADYPALLIDQQHAS